MGAVITAIRAPTNFLILFLFVIGRVNAPVVEASLKRLAAQFGFDTLLFVCAVNAWFVPKRRIARWTFLGRFGACVWVLVRFPQIAAAKALAEGEQFCGALHAKYRLLDTRFWSFDSVLAHRRNYATFPAVLQIKEKTLNLMQRGATAGLTGLISARIKLLPHQVHVVRRVLEDPVCRYLLADEVGLGKTIEAGIIARQLRLDKPNARILVVVPSALKKPSFKFHGQPRYFSSKLVHRKLPARVVMSKGSPTSHARTR